MKNISPLLPLLCLILLSSSCSSEQQNETQISEPKTQIFSNQVEALEKAKAVEQLIQNSADRQRQLIDAQSQ